MRIAGAGKALTVAAVFVAAGFGFGLGLALRDEFASTSVEAEPASAAEFLRSAPSPSAAPVAVPRPASSRRDAIVEVAQRTTPAVVTLGLILGERRDQSAGLPVRSLLRPHAEEIFRTFTQGASREQDVPYVGSGFIIDQTSLLGPGFNAMEGDTRTRYILTNYHVINTEDSPRIFVTLADGREFPAELLDADAIVDVALLRIVTDEPDSIPVTSLGDSDDIMVGETVLALGNPFGPMIDDPYPTVTLGVVSALHRSFQPQVDPKVRRPLVYRNMIQTDASINPGNSGGPLVNLDGEVIGINTFAISPEGAGSTGVNFATPINRAIDVAREIIRFGHVRPILVDLEVWSVNRYLMGRYNLSEASGLFVWKLSPDGPAAEAGLRRGDVILRVDGRRAYRPDDLIGTIYSRTVGEHINLTVSREGRTFETEYQVRQAPEE
jgi:S1-C subfamily serine protease